jgi:hypothetical protein
VPHVPCMHGAVLRPRPELHAMLAAVQACYWRAMRLQAVARSTAQAVTQRFTLAHGTRADARAGQGLVRNMLAENAQSGEFQTNCMAQRSHRQPCSQNATAHKQCSVARRALRQPGSCSD